MKGLLKGNLYAVLSNMKVFSVVILILGAFVVAVFSQPLLFGFVVLSMVGYSFLSLASFNKENASKWAKYKLAAPVRRFDITKSYFFSQLLWLAVGALVALAAIGFSYAIHGFPFDRGEDFWNLMVLGLSISLFMSAIFFPLHYTGDSDKNEASLFISLLCSVVIVAGIIRFTNWIFGTPMTEMQQIIAIMILFASSLLCFFVSIPLTDFIFKRKDG